MSEPHTEKYKVTNTSATASDLTLTVTPISVPDVGGPVSSILIRNFLPSGCTSLEGAENPVDVTAVIYANGTDFARAVNTIKKDKYSFSYLSTPGAPVGSECISHVSWAKL